MSLITGVDTKKFNKPLTKADSTKPSTSKDELASRAKRRRQDQTPEVTIELKNRFEILSESEDDEVEIHSDMEASQEKDDSTNTKVVKPPPIVLYQFIDKHYSTITNLKQQLSGNLTIKNKGNRLILHTENRTDYDILKTHIQLAKLDFHTYTPNEEKDYKFVLKKLPPNITPEDIKCDLASIGYEPKEVKQMTKKVDHKEIPLPVYVITYGNKIKVSEIYKIKVVCYCVVQWEKYKGNRLIQCYKCQAFEHVAKNCFKSPKCTICSGPHLRTECNNKENVKCSNCHNDHPANDKSCPIYIKHINLKEQSKEIRKQKLEQKREKKYSQKEDDYPQISKEQSEAKSPSTPAWPSKAQPEKSAETSDSSESEKSSGISEIFALVKSIFNSFNLAKIKKVIKDTHIKINNASDSFSKMSILFEAIVEIFD